MNTPYTRFYKMEAKIQGVTMGLLAFVSLAFVQPTHAVGAIEEEVAFTFHVTVHNDQKFVNVEKFRLIPLYGTFRETGVAYVIKFDLYKESTKIIILTAEKFEDGKPKLRLEGMYKGIDGTFKTFKDPLDITLFESHKIIYIDVSDQGVNEVYPD